MKTIYCIIGSSGSGKSTIAKILSDRVNCPELISHTTRKPRINEIPNQSYYFVTEAEYDNTDFVEMETYCNKRYGSSVKEVLDRLSDHDSVCAVVTYHGYEQYRDWAEKQKSIRVVSVFVDGGTEEDLVRRLTARGDSPEAIKERVAKYKQEQADYQHRVFDRVFVNTMPKDELEEAVVYFFK